jgi:small ligand-binding sensory domain FIST
VSDLIKKVKDEGRRPLFALYLNCAGRAASYSENTDEDVRHVQKAINNEFPLIGMYEAGELAVVGGDLQVLDWTGIFCLFSETENHG